MPDPKSKNPRVVTYFVNGEPQPTEEHKLSVKAILDGAGFDPVTDYRLTRDTGNHVFEDYDQEVPVHEGERFTATYIGPTPTS